MVYYTGDLHGDLRELTRFERLHLTAADIVVLLGDVGANYDGFRHDRLFKEALSALPPVFLCIHGNHEMRPGGIPSYKQKLWNGGVVWYEEKYPNLLFAGDGEIFDLGGVRHIAIGGAYSVDKYHRLVRGMAWWPDEQPDAAIRAYVEAQLAAHPVDVILSHTCPYRYEPTEAFLPGLDPARVDAGTEKWLDEIERAVSYRAWYCGHWHIDKRTERMHFLFREVETAE